MPDPTPDSPDLAQQRMRPALQVCRDVYGGTLTMREMGEKYLPRFEREETKDWQRRLEAAVLFNAFRKTAKGLAGMVFRKPITLREDVPAIIRDEHWENIDMAGRHGDVFCRDVFEDSWVDGHATIFVDMQEVQPGIVQTLADERALGLRPYWVAVKKEQIVRVRTINAGGRVILSRFAYKELVTEEDGEFGEREVLRVRDYRLVEVTEESEPRIRVVYIIHTRTKADGEKSEWRTAPARQMAINRIPVTTTYTNRTGFMESEPPLLDLALENILHYQTRADRQNVLHIASVPIPVIKGELDADEVTVGVNTAIRVTGDGDAYYMEPAGAALNHSRQELQDIEQRMAALGLAALQRQTRAAETAEAKRLDKAESDSQLAAAARALEDAIEAALEIHAQWLDRDSGGSAEVNKDFETTALSPQMAAILLQAVGSGALSLETMWAELQRGEILSDTFDPEVELQRLLGSGMVALPRPEPEVEGGEDDDEGDLAA